jgi:hypothetical protein
VSHQDEAAELEASGLFDAAWYLSQNADVRETAASPLPHFCYFGWREGRRPNRYFDPAWYLEQYADVKATDMNPLVHYARHGDREGRRPVWCFDPNWYRAAYDLPPDAIALAHFLTLRTTGCFAPMSELWSVLHIEPYSRDPEDGRDPFEHYLDDMLLLRQEASPDIPLVAASGLVDPNYYLINSNDVHEAAVDPVVHFCRYGWREARKPNLYFDLHWYLATNPSVVRLNVNPVVHYILRGEQAARRPVPYFDPAWYRQAYAVPSDQTALAHFISHRRRQAFSPTPLFDVAWYVQRHAEELGGDRDPFAHFLQVGMTRDIDPSPAFNMAEYRKRHLGRPSRQFRQFMHPERDNPLVHFLRAEYR